MFRQLFFVFLLLASFIGSNEAEKRVFYDGDDDDRIVVKPDAPLRLRTRRPIQFYPEGRHPERLQRKRYKWRTI
ncbi:unnamed protein product [Caenorhabditis nigoni]